MRFTMSVMVQGQSDKPKAGAGDKGMREADTSGAPEVLKWENR